MGSQIFEVLSVMVLPIFFLAEFFFLEWVGDRVEIYNFLREGRRGGRNMQFSEWEGDGGEM